MNFSGVMGHEFVGTVLEGPDEWCSRRVVGEINCPCGECELCGRGLGNHCRNRTVLGIDGRDGAFAECLSIPVANLHEVPDGVSDQCAVFAEPLAAALQIRRQVRIGEADTVVVLGAGRLGQLIARVLRGTVGRGLTVVGRHTSKLVVVEKAGVRAVHVDDFHGGGRADVVIDATGSASGFELAMRTVRPMGTIVLKSTFAADAGTNLSPLVIDEITVVGSRCGPFDEALEALATGEVDVADLVSRRMPLTEALEALTEACRAENIKVLIDVRM